MSSSVAASALTATVPDERRQTEDPETRDLKGRAVRGVLISGSAQGAAFVLRTGSMIVMARLLFPRDFGLFGMAAAFTGFLGLFRDCGLSMASVTRVSVTRDQLSTLFWVNLTVGFALAMLCSAVAPLLARFYGEPRLLMVTMALGLGFVFNGASAQHRAILQRNMKFGSLAVVDTIAWAASILVSVWMAATGYGYWALVTMTVAQPAVAAVGAWTSTRWIPGRPRRGSGVGSMLRYGGTVTFNTIVVYVAYNLDKVLLGRFWGAEVLGVYGRAYQLISIPTDNLNSTLSQVAFPALSRIQNDPARLRNYFLQGYGVFVALVVPLTVGCALFPDDIVRVFLGPKWGEATSIFRLLAPTMLVFAIINPFGWLMMATGHSARSLKIAFFIAPVVIIGYSLGLHNGPEAVALGFSCAMLVLAAPVVMWAKHQTLITSRDILAKVVPPLFAVALAAALVLATNGLTHNIAPTFWRLVIRTAVMFGAYLTVLLWPKNQRAAYTTVFREVRIGRNREGRQRD